MCCVCANVAISTVQTVVSPETYLCGVFSPTEYSASIRCVWKTSDYYIFYKKNMQIVDVEVFFAHIPRFWNRNHGEQTFGWISTIPYDSNPWASCQIRKIAGAHAPGMPGTLSPSPQVSDPDMHHGTCVTHVPWCMPGSLTSGFLWNRRRGKTFPAFPAHAQPAILRIW